jgi:hypothetical protein
MARNQLQQQVEGAIEIIEMDAKTALGSDIARLLRGDLLGTRKRFYDIFHGGTVLPYLQFAAPYA